MSTALGLSGAVGPESTLTYPEPSLLLPSKQFFGGVSVPESLTVASRRNILARQSLRYLLCLGFSCLFLNVGWGVLGWGVLGRSGCNSVTPLIATVDSADLAG